MVDHLTPVQEPPQDSRPQPEQCDACRYVTQALTRYEDSFGDWRHPARSVQWLCTLCANTPTGNMRRYPEHYDPAVYSLAQVVCYVGNVLLDEMRKGRQVVVHVDGRALATEVLSRLPAAARRGGLAE